jgi:hypothetical protein
MTNIKSISGIAVNMKKNAVFLEGELGTILDIELIEGKVLTIIGKNGTIRIDITKTELQQALSHKQKS